MKLKLDLHIHSEASPDGRMSVREIVARARANGLQGVAICDHDLLFQPQGDQTDTDVLVIPGIELSTECGHLLGLFLTGPVEGRDAPSLIQSIHAQGGLAILAHPFEHSRDPARLRALLPLLDGIEVWNGRANRKLADANALARRFAQENGLPGTGGSDAHLPREIGNGAVTVEVDAPTLAAVKQALRRPGNPVSGRNGRHLDAARSKRTKLSKQGAGPARWLEWLLFAGKCLLEDLCLGIRRRGKGDDAPCL